MSRWNVVPMIAMMLAAPNAAWCGTPPDAAPALARSDSAHIARTFADSTRTAGAPLDSAHAVHAPLDSARVVHAPLDSTRVVDYLWVVRTALLDPTDIPRVIDRAQEMGVRGLLVQVVGRGDAFYRSDLLPRSEALAAPAAADTAYDPLRELVREGHLAGLEVHAWMNCMLVWSAPEPPRDRRHVFHAHPEWMARMKDGRRLSQLSMRERRRLGVEGAYLAPAHPAVRTFLASVAAEIARRYDVDGIQLDYIRQPAVEVGYDPETRAQFALRTGVDPKRFATLPFAERAPMDSLWADFQCAQVTATVREVRDSLNQVRPGLSLSAAVLADTLAARTHHAQAWMDWVRSGLLDRAFVMCYAAPVQTVMSQLVTYAASFGHGGRVVPGIAVYNTSPALAAAKILGARELGFPRLALYSYDALGENSSYWPALRGSMAAAGRP
jgi:uncharacterized lipoprotein YddW (UPF0748 family)